MGHKVCEIDGCTQRHRAKGLCSMHYKRLQLTGDPNKRSRFDSEEEKRAFIAADRARRAERRARDHAFDRLARPKGFEPLTF